MGDKRCCVKRAPLEQEKLSGTVALFTASTTKNTAARGKRKKSQFGRGTKRAISLVKAQFDARSFSSPITKLLQLWQHISEDFTGTFHRGPNNLAELGRLSRSTYKCYSNTKFGRS
ncbi:hypothetical protein TRVL_08093 [Trypanosoma vivax]|nr:hypothetical protein TRVL_08093 [Trypanosoma vivax]